MQFDTTSCQLCGSAIPIGLTTCPCCGGAQTGTRRGAPLTLRTLIAVVLSAAVLFGWQWFKG
jgi:hypothetical protein